VTTTRAPGSLRAPSSSYAKDQRALPPPFGSFMPFGIGPGPFHVLGELVATPYLACYSSDGHGEPVADDE
jgi:hypothetical protein